MPKVTHFGCGTENEDLGLIAHGHVGAAQLEPAAGLLCGAAAQVRKKEIMFLIGAAPTDLCPRGQETENLFSPGFGEGEVPAAGPGISLKSHFILNIHANLAFALEAVFILK